MSLPVITRTDERSIQPKNILNRCWIAALLIAATFEAPKCEVCDDDGVCEKLWRNNGEEGKILRNDTTDVDVVFDNGVISLKSSTGNYGAFPLSLLNNPASTVHIAIHNDLHGRMAVTSRLIVVAGACAMRVCQARLQ